AVPAGLVVTRGGAPPPWVSQYRYSTEIQDCGSLSVMTGAAQSAGADGMAAAGACWAAGWAAAVAANIRQHRPELNSRRITTTLRPWRRKQRRRGDRCPGGGARKIGRPPLAAPHRRAGDADRDASPTGALGSIGRISVAASKRDRVEACGPEKRS